MYQDALVLVPAGPFCYFSLVSKSIPLFRGRNVKNGKWKPVKERCQIAVGLGKGGGWWWGDDLACPDIPSKGE